jgi:hypothetical protein
MARAHQIAAQILTGAHQVAQRFLLDARDRDAVQLTGHQQPDHPLGITTSVFTRSVAPRGINPGAHTTHSIPAASSLRANTNPVGPASYVARTASASPAANAVTSSLDPGSRCTRNSSRSELGVRIGEWRRYSSTVVRHSGHHARPRCADPEGRS